MFPLIGDNDVDGLSVPCMPIIGVFSATEVPTPDFYMPLASNLNIAIGQGTAIPDATPQFNEHGLITSSCNVDLTNPPIVGFVDCTMVADLCYNGVSADTNISAIFGIGGSPGMHIVCVANGFVIGNFNDAPNGGGEFSATVGQVYRMALRRKNGIVTVLVDGSTSLVEDATTNPIENSNRLLQNLQNVGEVIAFTNARFWNYALSDDQLRIA